MRMRGGRNKARETAHHPFKRLRGFLIGWLSLVLQVSLLSLSLCRFVCLTHTHTKVVEGGANECRMIALQVHCRKNCQCVFSLPLIFAFRKQAEM